MSGKWAGSTRSESLPPNWAQLCAAVHKRSRGRCEWPRNARGGDYRRCGQDADGGVDHWKGRDYHELDGLRDSCHAHHSKKSSAEGNAAKAARQAARYRPREAHPGRAR